MRARIRVIVGGRGLFSVSLSLSLSFALALKEAGLFLGAALVNIRCDVSALIMQARGASVCCSCGVYSLFRGCGELVPVLWIVGVNGSSS